MVTRIQDHQRNDVPLNPLEFIYTYSSHETELELCRMELQALFGLDHLTGIGSLLRSRQPLDPDRCPYITLRLDVMIMGSSVADIAAQVSSYELGETTFKVTYIKAGDPFTYDEQRGLERLVGSRIQGRANMKAPDITFGLMAVEGQWMLGVCNYPLRAWREHKDKPQNYSTGLSVTTARSLMNILVPKPDGVRAVDPCCGMGNVLIEALSMGIVIQGWDINPLAVRGARINLKHFGYPSVVTLGDMNGIEDSFDAAVLDMPYNLCSVLPAEEQLTMLLSLRRLAKRAVIVSTQDAEEQTRKAGFNMLDSCKVWKGSFVRNIWLCE